MIDSGGETAHGDLLAAQGVEPPGPGRPVLVLFDQKALHNWHLLVQKETLIGRDASAHIRVPDETVSRIHARVLYDTIDRPHENPVCRLVDNGSRNGTFLNGRRVAEPVALQGGDRIFIGSCCLVYQLRTDLEIHSDQKLRALATTDALTGMLNRGYMAIQFQREFDRARRYTRPLAVMMVDLDSFKKINDTYGHSVGDAVLEKIGTQIGAKVRLHDVAGRYGGEEFAVMLPETAMQGALVMAERLRRSIESLLIRVDDVLLNVTVSIGVAAAGAVLDDTMELLLARAETALLRAKAEGRNRVCAE